MDRYKQINLAENLRFMVISTIDYHLNYKARDN